MSDKQLKDKAIKIKGKDYVLVSDRVSYFNENYTNGRIETKLVSDPTSEMIIVKAVITPDSSNNERFFTGYSQAVIGDGMVNKTAALENAETSAVGRALGFMGIGVIDSIASSDELAKAQTNTMRYATEKQVKWLRDTAHEVNDQLGDDEETDKWIEEQLTVKPQRVPIFKVKDAVDKLREEEPIAEIDTSDLKVDDKDIKGLKNGDVPY